MSPAASLSRRARIPRTCTRVHEEAAVVGGSFVLERAEGEGCSHGVRSAWGVPVLGAMSIVGVVSGGISTRRSRLLTFVASFRYVLYNMS